MLIKTGTDIVEISRIEKSLKNPRFVSRVFSPDEMRFLITRSFSPQTVAVNFCAKEAFIKTIGGFRGMKMNEISILRDSMGAPYIMLSGTAKIIANRMKLSFTVSLSHCREYATAVVVGYERK